MSENGRTFRSFWMAHDRINELTSAAFRLDVRMAVRHGYSAERLGGLQIEEVTP
jgi:hypothetical protein